MNSFNIATDPCRIVCYKEMSSKKKHIAHIKKKSVESYRSKRKSVRKIEK